MSHLQHAEIFIVGVNQVTDLSTLAHEVDCALAKNKEVSESLLTLSNKIQQYT